MNYIRSGILTTISFVTVSLACIAANPQNYKDDYAPIVEFNMLIVNVYPTGFGGDYSGPCVYVNIIPRTVGYTFQYWFYYRYDIRLSPREDAYLDSLLQRVADLGILEREIDKLFHEHDWELVEVDVSLLGSSPDRVTYYAHGSGFSLPVDGWGWTAPMNGNHPVVKVITNMHGSYPAGAWSPFIGGWNSLKVSLEFLLASVWEHCAGYAPEVGHAPPYNRIDFTNRCRPFSSRLTSVHSLAGYPYELPWDRDFGY